MKNKKDLIKIRAAGVKLGSPFHYSYLKCKNVI